MRPWTLMPEHASNANPLLSMLGKCCRIANKQIPLWFSVSTVHSQLSTDEVSSSSVHPSQRQLGTEAQDASFCFKSSPAHVLLHSEPTSSSSASPAQVLCSKFSAAHSLLISEETSSSSAPPAQAAKSTEAPSLAKRRRLKGKQSEPSSKS